MEKPLYRSKALDPDFRPKMHGKKNPCCRCQKEIRGDNHRMAHVIDAGFRVLHPADEQAYYASPEGKSGAGDLHWLPIGSDCAKKIGLEWSLSLEDIK